MKNIFPVVWFGSLVVAFLVIFLPGRGGRPAPAAFAIVPIVMAGLGYFLMKKLVFDIVDEVWDDGNELVVRNKGQEERIPLSNIMNVSYSYATNPQRVTLTLRNAGLLGKEVTFTPPARFMPLSKSPIVTDLIERIDAARRR